MSEQEGDGESSSCFAILRFVCFCFVFAQVWQSHPSAFALGGGDCFRASDVWLVFTGGGTILKGPEDGN